MTSTTFCPLTSLPSAVTVKQFPDGIRWILPRHTLGAWRWIAAPMLLIPLAIMAFYWFSWESHSWVPCLLTLALTSPLLGLGLFILAGHVEISLRGNTLRATEAFGPLRWTRRRRVDRIDRFTVVSGENPTSAATNDARNSCGLVAEGAGIKPLIVFMGYPQEWGLLIGQELAQRSNASFRQETTGQGSIGPAGDLGSALLNAVSPSPRSPESHPADVVDLFRPPKGSGISSTEDAQGLMITVPSIGATRVASHWLIIAGVLLSMLGATLLALLLGMRVKGADPVPMALYALAALAMLLRAFQLGRRQTTFCIQARSLTVRQNDPFRSRQWHWPHGSLEGIGRCSDGGTRSTTRWRLEVRAKDGRSCSLLGGYDEITLDWLTKVLLHVLR